MTRATLSRIGLALYGSEHWKKSLAYDLQVSGRRMRYWVAGDEPIPDGVGAELRALLLARLTEIKAIAQDLAA